jgi:hypothetical protein
MTNKKEEEGIKVPVGEPGPLGPAGIDNSQGPAAYQRDDHGLLRNVQYEFNEDGSINWRAMIKEEHLFPNKSHFDMYKKPMPKSIKGLRDNQLLIKLSGIKELAKLRGFTNINYQTVKCQQDHVAVSCGISFIPNYETGNQEIFFEDMANATLNNTSSFATKFLETIACNRAFVRCVRNFLNVHIVGDDEIDKSDKNSTQFAPSTQTSNTLSPNSLLLSHLERDKGISNFNDFKDYLRTLWAEDKYRNEEIKNWSSFEDIPAKEARILLGLIK